MIKRNVDVRVPGDFWYMIEDGVKTSPLIFSLTSAYDYISEHDFSPSAVIYWGILKPTLKPEHKSQKDFVIRGGMFVFDFLEACVHG